MTQPLSLPDPDRPFGVSATAPAPGEPGHREFDVPWAPAGGATAMTVALARHLAELLEISRSDGRQVLCVEVLGPGNRYTQALIQVEGVVVEAASNHNLDPRHALDEVRLERLDDLGFTRPLEDDLLHWPNHHVIMDAPVDLQYAADLLVAPLALAFDVTSSDTIRVKSFPA